MPHHFMLWALVVLAASSTIHGAATDGDDDDVCTAVCPAGVCDSVADVQKPECAACVACQNNQGDDDSGDGSVVTIASAVAAPTTAAAMATGASVVAAPTTAAAMATEAAKIAAVLGTATEYANLGLDQYLGPSRMDQCRKVSLAWTAYCANVTTGTCDALQIEREAAMSKQGYTWDAPSNDKVRMCCEDDGGYCPPDGGACTTKVKVGTCDNVDDDLRRRLLAGGADEADCCDVCAHSDPSSALYKAKCIAASYKGSAVCGEFANGTAGGGNSALYPGECATSPSHKLEGTDCQWNEAAQKDVCECKARVGDIVAFHTATEAAKVNQTCLERVGYGCDQAALSEAGCDEAALEKWSTAMDSNLTKTSASYVASVFANATQGRCGGIVAACACQKCGAAVLAADMLAGLKIQAAPAAMVCSATAGQYTTALDAAYKEVGVVDISGNAAAERGRDSIMGFLRPYVINAPGVATRASIGIDIENSDKNGHECVGSVMFPYTESNITVVGGTAWVFAPTVAAGKITVTGHTSATIVGGSNAGLVDVASTGVIRIVNLVNSGNVKVAGGRNLLIAGVENTGDINVTDTDASLHNCSNAAALTFDGGTFYAYGIINTGTVSIERGHGVVELICNTGSIEFKDGTSGSLTVPAGTAVTVASSANVAVTYSTGASQCGWGAADDSGAGAGGERGLSPGAGPVPTPAPTPAPTLPPLQQAKFSLNSDCSQMNSTELSTTKENSKQAFADASGLKVADITRVQFDGPGCAVTAGRRARAASIDVTLTFAPTVSAMDAYTAVEYSKLMASAGQFKVVVAQGGGTITVKPSQQSITRASIAHPSTATKKQPTDQPLSNSAARLRARGLAPVALAVAVGVAAQQLLLG